jgi:hypothetical protein
VMTPDPTPARPGVAQTAFVEFNFNVDLRAQLSLPKEEARYAVFLWLDEMTSPVQIVDLPGPKAEASALEKLQSAPSAPESFSFRKTESSPDPKNSEIVLAQKGVTRVYGAVNPSLFSSQKKETGEHLTVLALDYMSRRLKWRSAAIPEEILQKRECYFDFDLFNLSGDFEEDAKARPYRKIFLLVHTRGALSDVLTVSRRMD